MLLMLLFVALVAAIHEYAPPAREIYSLLGLCVAVIAAAVLLIDYYIQVTVLQPSLEKGQLDGWAMLTQYNPNGVFIALEEIGYLLMSLVLLCLAPVFGRKDRIERALRWLFTVSFAQPILSLDRRLGVQRHRSRRHLRDHRDLHRLADAHRSGTTRGGGIEATDPPVAARSIGGSGNASEHRFGARKKRGGRDASQSHPAPSSVAFFRRWASP